MRAVTDFLDRVFTPLRPKLFTVITPEDLHEDHIALDGRTNDVSARFKEYGTEHDTMKANLDSLDDEHNPILADVKGRIKEHQTFNRKISEISEKTDAIEAKLDHICEFFRRWGQL